MKRWNGSAAARFGIVMMGVVVFAGCTRPAVVSRESTASASSPVQSGDQELTETTLPVGATAPAAGALDVREIKVIEDNGQQGLFVKLSAPPAAVTHYVLDQPSRLVIDIAGTDGVGAETSSQEYAVKNPVISEIGVGRVEGKLRLTVALRSASAPTYTVNDLNDTVVAFLGEPTGGTQPVREQLVFTRRAVETAEREAPPPAARRAPAAKVARPVSAAAESRGTSARVTVSETGTASDTPAHKGYYGQHVSLDFKDADVHNVLRLLAEVSKLNIVATDDVRGKVTLRLFDVPWDQAFDIVLEVLSLESTQEGNVLRISTVRRLREEREELRKAQEAARAVEPLHVDYIKVNYAKAVKLAEIMSGAGLNAVRNRVGGAVENGVLTSRGSVFVDEYTNTLIVRDIQKGIDNARELVRRLDVQTPQVLIESNIVEATTDFSRDLGIQWGYRYLAGPATGNPTGFNFPGTVGLGGSGVGAGTGGVPFLANFPAPVDAVAGGSAFDLALGSINGAQSLDVRLTALEKEGKARIISRPRVVTLNNIAATIKSLTILRVKLPSTGTVINTGAGGAAGAASTATEKIETGIILVVTPQVSSDGYVLLDMYAKSSQADFTVTVDQIPTEISREANSHILVRNGQTVVLGGIYRDNNSINQVGIPFLRDIPGIRWLFQSTSRQDRREDLLVFLTPRIMGGVQGSLPSAEELWKNQEPGKEG